MSQRLLPLAAMVALASQACGGYAMMQTARTQPRGSVALVTGTSIVSNLERASEAKTVDSGIVPDLAARVGVSRRVDVSVSAYVVGLGLTAKMNVLPLSSKFALSPRIGVAGGAITDGSVIAGMAGGLVSFDATRGVSLYAGAMFFNHWIRQPRPSWARLQAGDQAVGRKGYGDGLLQMGAGISAGDERVMVVMFEYNRLTPMQDDPGDYYKFQSANLFSIAFGFCVDSLCGP
ncbi:MAG: hypothetical protein HY898_29920 [Deltaproteobacteria bacterium]|nr:hypothetical protein [Deltaproteobacteria bacterium]